MYLDKIEEFYTGVDWIEEIENWWIEMNMDEKH